MRCKYIDKQITVKTHMEITYQLGIITNNKSETETEIESKRPPIWKSLTLIIDWTAPNEPKSLNRWILNEIQINFKFKVKNVPGKWRK